MERHILSNCYILGTVKNSRISVISTLKSILWSKSYYMYVKTKLTWTGVPTIVHRLSDRHGIWTEVCGSRFQVLTTLITVPVPIHEWRTHGMAVTTISGCPQNPKAAPARASWITAWCRSSRSARSSRALRMHPPSVQKSQKCTRMGTKVVGGSHSSAPSELERPENPQQYFTNISSSLPGKMNRFHLM